MTTTLHFYNPTTCESGEFILGECPRCYGFGATTRDNGDECPLCDGHGETYSRKGWHVSPANAANRDTAPNCY